MNEEVDCRECKHMAWCKDKHDHGFSLTWQNCKEGEKFEPKQPLPGINAAQSAI
jgi:hypothetical protein